jgi:uncharacterized membrane protein
VLAARRSVNHRSWQLPSRLEAAWQRLRTSLWLVPGLIVFGATALAALLVTIDFRYGDQLVERWPNLLGAGVDGARATLTVIAGSMVTVAGVVFSITLVVLSSAAAQYSPRVLRNFMADRLNQSVLGAFVGVYAYCLVVLRTIHGGEEDTFVPAVAVLGGVVLAFVGVGYLIYFIHHVGVSIQASAIMDRIAADTLRSLHTDADHNGHDPEQDSAGSRASTGAGDRPLRTVSVQACETGYVVRVDVPALLQHAREHDLFIGMERELGEFVVVGQPLVTVAASEEPSEALQRKVVHAIEIQRERTAEFDPAYGLRQIVDVALKAMSSGINDPTTARIAIDRLTAIFIEMERVEPRRRAFCLTAAGLPRVRVRLPSYAALIRNSYAEIRQTSKDNVAVLRALATSLGSLQAEVTEPQRRAALLVEAQALRQQVEALTDQVDSDRCELRASTARLVASLDTVGNLREGMKW